MSRIKMIFLSMYALIFALFLAAIFYYGWKERERNEQEKDIAIEEGREQGIVELEETTGQEGKVPLGNQEQKNGGEISAISGYNGLAGQKSEAAVSDERKVGKDTVYRLEIYDTFTQRLDVQEGEMPPGFLGMTREELSNYWENYINNLPIQEFEKGLLSCELTAFSANQVTVRKTYDGSGMKYRYYMVLEQGCITVYYSDKKTIYENTDILEEDLPKNEVEKLKKGVYIEDEKSLYSILESYTS